MTKIDDFLEEVRKDIYEDKKRIERVIEENEVSQVLADYLKLRRPEKVLRTLKRQLKNCLDKRIKKGK